MFRASAKLLLLGLLALRAAAASISARSPICNLIRRDECTFGTSCGNGCATGPCCDAVAGVSCDEGMQCITINGVTGCCPEGETCGYIATCINFSDPACSRNSTAAGCCPSEAPYCNAARGICSPLLVSSSVTPSFKTTRTFSPPTALETTSTSVTALPSSSFEGAAPTSASGPAPVIVTVTVTSPAAAVTVTVPASTRSYGWGTTSSSPASISTPSPSSSSSSSATSSETLFRETFVFDSWNATSTVGVPVETGIVTDTAVAPAVSSSSSSSSSDGGSSFSVSPPPTGSPMPLPSGNTTEISIGNGGISMHTQSAAGRIRDVGLPAAVTALMAVFVLLQ